MSIISEQKEIISFLEEQRKELTAAKATVTDTAKTQDLRKNLADMARYYNSFCVLSNCDAYKTYGKTILEDKFKDFKGIQVQWSPVSHWQFAILEFGLWRAIISIDENIVEFYYIGESLEEPTIKETPTYLKALAYEQLRSTEIKFGEFLKIAYKGKNKLVALIRWQFDKKDNFNWAFEYLDKVRAELFNAKTAHRKIVNKFNNSENDFHRFYYKIWELFPDSEFDFENCIPEAWHELPIEDK